MLIEIVARVVRPICLYSLAIKYVQLFVLCIVLLLYEYKGCFIRFRVNTGLLSVSVGYCRTPSLKPPL